MRDRAVRLGSQALIALCAAALAGCVATRRPAASSARATRSAVETYLREIEPIRLAVNALLDQADPILHGFADGRVSPAGAASRMGRLERRFAAYTVDVAAIAPAMPALRALHVTYAHTYVLEDAYLSALTAGLAQDDLAHLPSTQSAQRVAIIEWRTGLTVLAGSARVALPTDLQQAGRGEIAPAPGGS